jgi:hypothetical protein
MNTRSSKMKLIVMVIVLMAAAIGWVTWPADRALAIQDSEDRPSPFGIAFGQTARLTVLNGGDRGYVIDWKFVDGQGRTLAGTRQPEVIPPGQFVSFDLGGDSIGLARDHFGRVQAQAVVTSIGNTNDKNLHVSVELFDNATGRTTSFISAGVIKGFNPPPESSRASN